MIKLHFECLLNHDVKVNLETLESNNDWVIWYQAEDINHWYKYHIITLCEKGCYPKCNFDNCVIVMMTAISSYEILKVRSSSANQTTSSDKFSIIRTRRMPVPQPRFHYNL